MLPFREIATALPLSMPRNDIVHCTDALCIIENEPEIHLFFGKK